MMMPSGLMTSVDLHSLMCNACSLKLAAKSAPVKLLSDSICLKCRQEWQESLETLVSSMIESFFIDLESDSSVHMSCKIYFLRVMWK